MAVKPLTKGIKYLFISNFSATKKSEEERQKKGLEISSVIQTKLRLIKLKS